MNGKKHKLGLIGFPLSHSFSKKYFEEKFRKENINDFAYELFPIETIDSFNGLLKAEPELIGLNVTIPYKEKIIPFLNDLDDTARAVGAVNCIKINEVNSIKTLKGYNTDVFGFRQSIKPFLEPQHERALIIGTGGASKAVEFVLSQIGVECWFLSRNKVVSAKNNCLTYAEMNEYVINAFKLIVNTSPVGMYPHQNDCPNIPYQFITAGHLLYDLVYNPEETLFMKKGREQGAVVINGLSMLHQQADKAWDIWRSKD